MLTFNKIGKNGRLGNQMFQYATLKGIATNRGLEYCIPKSPNIDEYQHHQLLHCFKMSGVNINDYSGSNKYIESYYSFDEKLFNSCNDDTDIFGYFQSYKYFNHIKDDLIKDFTFKKPVDFKDFNYVAIHVRRGDYVGNQDFYVEQGENYYCNAISYFDKDTNFIILSDDINWCKNQWYFINNSNITFITKTNNFDSLYLMTKASGNIIANSSLSWWGAYLNEKSQAIIYPKRWWGPKLLHQGTRDLIPKEWIGI